MNDMTRRFSAPAAPRPMEATDGILLMDKPAGPTSHDIVAKIRHTFRLPKVGHGGTLDPQATGLLILLLGRGTKLSDRFIGSDKTYEGVIRLGISTDSQDAQGKILQESDPSAVTREQLEAEMSRFTGDIYQTPPMVSAIKMNGVPLYKRARKGQVVEREPRLIHVYEFSLQDFTSPRGRFVLRCTKGTYARTLCADVGEKLGCGAHLEELRRTECGEFNVKDAQNMDTVLGMSLQDLIEVLIPIHRIAPRKPT